MQPPDRLCPLPLSRNLSKAEMGGLNRQSMSNILSGRFRAILLNTLCRLIFAASGDDPVELLKTAATTYVPVNHTITAPNAQETPSQYRPPINEVISTIQSSPWYKDQIIHRRTVPPKDAQTGRSGLSSLRSAFALFFSRFLESAYLAADLQRPFKATQHKHSVLPPNRCHQCHTIRQKRCCFDQHCIRQKCDISGFFCRCFLLFSWVN